MPQVRIPETTGKPQKPVNLSKDAEKIWDEQIDELYEAGALDVKDSQVFGELCEAMADLIRARHHLKKTGGPIVVSTHGAKKKNPWLYALSDAWQHWFRLSRLFPISPKARLELKSDPTANEDSEVSSFLD